MPDNQKQISRKIAEILLDIEAVLFNGEDPFTLTSGRRSPVYIDCRKIISFPDARNAVIDGAIEVLTKAGVVEHTDMIAGGETAGIPYAAWISDRLNMPMLYVRKKPKGFGRMAQIEGFLDEKDKKKVLLVEDLTTDGGSKVTFCNVLRDAGAEVTDVFSVFYYDIFPQSQKILGDAGVKLHYLTTWHDVLFVAREKKLFSDETLNVVASFLDAPLKWEEDYTSRISA